MTYRELLCKATKLCRKGEITVSQYVEMTKPLDREVEQEPFKPMVEIDLYSVIKQSYIEREVLDKIRAEIESIERYGTNNGHDLWLRTPEEIKEDALKIIEKYKAESEDKE